MATSTAAGVVSFEEARRIVDQRAAQLRATEVESIAILDAASRVLAEPVVADRDFPPFPRATRDGYAVRAEDLLPLPTRLRLIGEIKAGLMPADSIALQKGQAVSIMTGASLPRGSDAVVMVEYTSRNGSEVEIQRAVKAGENFVPRGAEARHGQTLLDRGTRIDHAGIAIAAAVGASRLVVFRKPQIAVLSTGDEVVDIEQTPGPAQIRNSNTYSLAAQIQEAGGEAVLLPIAPDEPRRLRQLIEEGLRSDLLLLTGGVSMGKYDLVEQVLEELKAEFYFTGAQIQPGKPVVFGAVPVAPDVGRKFFFGLPGNPVSTMVTFDLFVVPVIEALAGMKSRPLIFPRAKLKSNVRTKTGLKRFLPALLSGEYENSEVELARWEGSGDIAALARANCYLVVPPDREFIEAGEWVPVLMR